jgi:hypothetical protein
VVKVAIAFTGTCGWQASTFAFQGAEEEKVSWRAVSGWTGHQEEPRLMELAQQGRRTQVVDAVQPGMAG